MVSYEKLVHLPAKQNPPPLGVGSTSKPLLYYINEKSLCELGKPAFEDEYEEWKFGKVLADVYYEFSIYTSFPIINVDVNPEVPKDIEKIIQKVVKELSPIPTWKLIDRMLIENV